MDNSNKIILDLCGGTGEWSEPYKQAGYDVRVITLPDNDVRLYAPLDSNKVTLNVYGIFAAPPCDQFSKAKHFHGKGNYTHDFAAGLEIVSACFRIIVTANPTFWSMENPNGYLSNYLGRPRFSFQPYYFGDNYQKSTVLWGVFNVPKILTLDKSDGLIKFSMLKSKDIHPEYYGKLSRKERRAITPAGFAKAFFEANP